MRFAAHRGGAALWPENSLRAFREALALASPLLEFDVHPTADGRIAVVHDPVLDRTTEGTGPVAARSADALRRLRLRGPDGALTEERLPLLEDVLALAAPSPAGLLVEIKAPVPGAGVLWERAGDRVRAVGGARYEGLEALVVDALRAAGLLERATIMAFNPEVLARVQALVPAQRTTLLVAAAHVALVGVAPEATIEWTVAAGATDAGLQHTLVDERVVRAAHAAGRLLGVWTVNDEPVMRRLAALGVDVLTTDRPDLARRVVGGGA